MSVLKSPQAAGRGAKRMGTSADLAAPGESVVREFPQRGSMFRKAVKRNAKIEVQRAIEELHGNLVEAAGFDAQEEIYRRAAQYPMGTGKDPIRIGLVRRTVWELWNAAQAAKGNAVRREDERLPWEGAHGD